MTAALKKAWGVPREWSAVLWGSVAPDIPLYLLTFGTLGWMHWKLGWSGEQTARLMFGQLYFHNPWWIAAHNLLHAPILLLAGLAATRLLRPRAPRTAHWLFWFFAACLLHSVVDVLTHYDDGPLVFFPFDWTFRVHSPVSYWDPAHHGREFARAEMAFDLVLLLYLAAGPLARRFTRRGKRDPVT